MSNVRTEISTGDAMPSWIVLLVELFLDVRGNVLFNVMLLNGLRGYVNSVLLHILRHVSVFHDSFASIGHFKTTFFYTMLFAFCCTTVSGLCIFQLCMMYATGNAQLFS